MTSLDSPRSFSRLAGFSLAFSLAAAVALAPSPAEAAPSPSQKMKSKGGNFGLGLTLGDPMGASAKLFVHPAHALQFDLGWAPLHHGAGDFTFTYLWHPAVWADTSVMDFMGYLGIGIGAGVWSTHHGYGHHFREHNHHHTFFGFLLRAPVLGLAFHWKKVPMDTVIEGAWSPYLVEAWAHDARVGLGHGDVSVKARYYF